MSNGAPEVASTGSTLAQVDADLKAVIDALVDLGANLLTGQWVMSPKTATSLSLLRGTGGAAAFPGIGPQGGVLLGMPVLTSAAVSGYIALLDGSGIGIGNDGDIRLDYAESATLQMSSTPDSPATAGTVAVSMFQVNCVAARGEIYRGWFARSGAAAYISGVTY